MMDPAGEHPVAVAAQDPDRPAITMVGNGETRTYGQLDDASRRLALVMRDAGLRRGDHLAVLLKNRPEFFEAIWAGLRSGLYVTPVNWHLAPAEAAFIVDDCEASALVTEASLTQVANALTTPLEDLGVHLALDGASARNTSDLDAATAPDSPDDAMFGFSSYEEALAAREPAEVPDECEGAWMFYSSGTTGRPKGVVPGPVGEPLGSPQKFSVLLTALFGFTRDSVYLSPAPLYHAAPAGWTSAAQRLGCSIVVMESFDPVALLAAIQKYRVTHLQVVPTHLVRLLKLPEEARKAYDLSSLEVVVHAAAPCPPEVKRRVIKWLGPIVHEYYAGSEGNGFCAINSQDWLAHPGSVGVSLLGAVHIVGTDGEELPVGEEGRIYFESPRQFSYHGDPGKTAEAWDDHGWSTIGDIGRLDEDGFLYLTDRVSNMIISGGVNIYPREIEDVLIMHPGVADVAVIGTPDEDLGERVTAVVQSAGEPTGAAASGLGDQLMEYCRARISGFKCPREVRFVETLPRSPSGKLLKRLLEAGP